MQKKTKFKIESLVVGALQTNCYLVIDAETQEAIIVDPGDDAEFIMNKIRDFNLLPQTIVATHGHFDHILAAWEIQQAYKIPFLLHAKDTFLISRMRETASYFLGYKVVNPPPQIDGDLTSRLMLGKGELKIIPTPGHTPGSVSIMSQDQWILTGDTLFANGAVGRTDFEYGNEKLLHKSIELLFQLDPKLLIYPGHGESSDLKTEKTYIIPPPNRGESYAINNSKI